MKIKLKPGSLKRVKEWASEVDRRRGEARETMIAKGVIIEAIVLDSTEHGDYLIFYAKEKDSRRALEVSQQSQFPIEADLKAFGQETFEKVEMLDVIIDLENLS